ncbi:MAG: nodulation protein V [Epsilonproteobacteria bacterium]|nr:MAG: nodulation protein V [Campylobacterota bacterium]
MHYKELLNTLNIFEIDKEGHYTYCSNTFSKLLGYSSNELIGRAIFKFMSSEEAKRVKDILTLHISNKTAVVDCESIYIHKDGYEITLMINAIPILNKNGDVVNFQCIAKDISQEKKRLKETIILEERLELALEHQSRMAQMGEMIGMIAHQWRQPLNSISLTASSLQLKFDFEEYDAKSEESFYKCTQDFSQGLDNIQEYIRTLSRTIDDFRNFYKIDKESTNIKLEDIASKALKIINPSLVAGNIEIIEEYDSDKTIKLYENEIIQVILTILQNAQDNFLEKKTKKPSIKITTKNRTISICDNGGGVPKDILSKIFDPYFSTKLHKNGTGLGLYMSRTIIEKHHKGKLKVKNSDDGACFTIEF